MRILKSLMMSFFLSSYISIAVAADASVTISSPINGAKISKKSKIEVSYEIVPGSNGDHIHLYVDDKEAVVIRKLKSIYTIEALDPGKHAICIKIVNKGHTPIGSQACININVI